MKALGRHILVELYECSPEILTDVIMIEKAMVTAAENAGATVINSTFHHFSPFGVSGVVVIQESHLAIHTWPEYGYAAVDLFTCGEPVDPWIAYEYLKKELNANHGSSMEIRRGQLNLLKDSGFHTTETESPSGKPDPHYSRNIWFTDRDEYVALSLRHTGDTLFRKQSPFQKVEIYDTYGYGKMLANDGMVMTTEKDEYVYHEMIAHVPMLTHPRPERALVIGGGDGGTVRELLRHPGLEEVIMVEIDEVVVEASRKHLPSLSTAFDNPRLKLIIDDGIEYVRQAAENSFDVVIVDSTDPVGPAEGLFTEEFYRNVHCILRDNGILVAQSESPRFNVHVFKEIHQTFRKIFGNSHVHNYLVYIPTYPTGMWSFAYAAKGAIHPVNSLNTEKANRFSEQEDLKYYSGEIHKAAFVIPAFVRKLISP